MSDTDTRDPAAEPTPEQWVDEFLAKSRSEQVAFADRARFAFRRSALCWERAHELHIDALEAEITRQKRDRGEAREEAARLRGVVEAVRALADEWGIFSGDDDDFFEAITDSGSWRFARDLREALASVPSSGETGERWECSACGAPGSACMDGDGGCCDVCRATGGCSHDPAPASSEPTGADERAMLALIDERDQAQAWADRLAAALAPADVIGEHSSANDPWQNALDYAAARPVLSREAVVIRDDDEWDDEVYRIDGVCWLYAEGHPWIAWCTEDGDWYAIRALTEDDKPTPGYAVTPEPMEAIPYPWVLESVHHLAAVLDTQEAVSDDRS